MENLTPLEKEMVSVDKEVSDMGLLCLKAVHSTMLAFKAQDTELAKNVVEGDKPIDAYYKEIEQKTFRIMLLDQPYAGEFRNMGAALKMITDLERIGDYCVDIAEEVLAFPQEPYYPKTDKILQMFGCVESMVGKALKSYSDKDVPSARSLNKDDDRVDRLFLEEKKDLMDLLRSKESKYDDQTIVFMMIAKYLERIGDHAVNIGEWVDYSSTGTHSIS